MKSRLKNSKAKTMGLRKYITERQRGETGEGESG